MSLRPTNGDESRQPALTDGMQTPGTASRTPTAGRSMARLSTERSEESALQSSPPAAPRSDTLEGFFPQLVKPLQASLALLAIVLFACSSNGLAQSLPEKAQHAKELMAAGKPGEAIPIYRELIRAIPDNPGLI